MNGTYKLFKRLNLFIQSIICATVIGLVCKGLIVGVPLIPDVVVGIGEKIKYVYDHIDFNPPPIKEKHPQ